MSFLHQKCDTCWVKNGNSSQVAAQLPAKTKKTPWIVQNLFPAANLELTLANIICAIFCAAVTCLCGINLPTHRHNVDYVLSLQLVPVCVQFLRLSHCPCESVSGFRFRNVLDEWLIASAGSTVTNIIKFYFSFIQNIFYACKHVCVCVWALSFQLSTMFPRYILLYSKSPHYL